MSRCFVKVSMQVEVELHQAWSGSDTLERISRAAKAQAVSVVGNALELRDARISVDDRSVVALSFRMEEP